jgi:hypothetical protein
MPKIGDSREDGFRFAGSNRRKAGGPKYETWLSPEAWERRAKATGRIWKARRERTYANPEELEKYREYARFYAAKRRAEKPESEMLSRVRARARLRGLDFSLTLDDITIPDICPVLGIPLKKGIGVACDNSPELDRIKNDIGYVPGNVMVISRRANRIKNDATVDELLTIASFYKGLGKG